ncbi:hypothetical protein CAOG_03823 [Capsaspora owczarzaki ATCC 30864]|uniref:BZIP domain-containing protein n=1 Tax=Capsaspora owczarzaki (strain ATCC 30864) TaxID=595528 RepID=A0A0D2UD10_CAPO3|nr:hypothetical protein CAOG_03823 [Capsaspora owczarzaki ATCC 30864]KJE92951.1 hypothetical protein CAOG_003823 [Capsaspora owczarzaki ATCC 30864]|eukprot:XP_004363551.1 hypothetical protein CAOG_03823 [Capsaspora owczarzaki ATCC 30864]
MTIEPSFASQILNFPCTAPISAIADDTSAMMLMLEPSFVPQFRGDLNDFPSSDMLEFDAALLAFEAAAASEGLARVCKQSPCASDASSVSDSAVSDAADRASFASEPAWLSQTFDFSLHSNADVKKRSGRAPTHHTNTKNNMSFIDESVSPRKRRAEEALRDPRSSGASQSLSGSPRVSPVASPAVHLSTDRQLEAGETLADYLDKRKKNNDAVKKCRARKRMAVVATEEECQRLSGENASLRDRVGSLEAEVAYLKNLLISATAVAANLA